jgi:hypothetical protein
MAKSQRKLKALEGVCPSCGAEVETVWMTSGTAIRVDPKTVRVIFTNQANANGFTSNGWIKHVCKNAGK